MVGGTGMETGEEAGNAGADQGVSRGSVEKWSSSGSVTKREEEIS